MDIERTSEISSDSVDLSIVIRCGRDRQGLLRCINSIDTNAEIIVSAAADASFLDEIREQGYLVSPHEYGNWSKAAEVGVQAARNNKIIIMDSDSTFAPGAIQKINTALNSGYPLVQPHVVFLVDRSIFSKVISKARSHENYYIPKAYSPGLGFKRQELLNVIGQNGAIYNPNVLYGDDGYLDQEVKKKGLEVHVEPEAIIYHDPVSIKHEIKATFRFGQGERQLEQIPTGIWKQIVAGFFSNDMQRYLKTAGTTYGADAAVFIALCKLIYIAGYGYENFQRKNG